MDGRILNYCAMPCVKSLLMIFNAFFWVSGLTLIWAGIWMRTDLEDYLKISTEYSENAPYVLVVLGTIILFTASLACSCTVRGQPFLLYIYGAFLLVFLFAEIALVAFIYTYKDHLAAGYDLGLRQDIRHYNQSYSQPIDLIQVKLRCCGVNTYKDWTMSPRKEVPKSCCIDQNTSCNPKNPSHLYETGCYEMLMEILNENMALIGIISSALAFFPLIGMILSCCLASNAKKASYTQVP